MATVVKWPGPTDRVAVVGRTGSGKTTAGMWHLSGKNFDLQPWVLVNTKGDPLINEIAEIKGVQTIPLSATPGEKGLYVINPMPHEDEELNAFFGRVWEKQNCGLYIDEGYMIGNTEKFNGCLTQGRSRRIPMIVLSQRPAWISKFVFTECDFVQLFNLQHRKDRKNVSEFVPVDVDYRLAKYCSLWYNVADNELVEFGPVPEKTAIIETFRAKFPPSDAQQLGGETPTQVRRTPQRRLV